MVTILKYMYPDDTMVDYVYGAYFTTKPTGLFASLYSLDPGIQGHTTTLAEVAKAKRLPTVYYEPRTTSH